MGFFDSLMGNAQQRQVVAKQEMEKKMYVAIMDFLKAQERFDMSTFETVLLDAKKTAGVDSWRKLLRSAAEQEELERDVGAMTRVAEALTEDEKLDPRIIRRPQKLRIARDAGVEVPAVNRFFTEYESFGALHEWIHARMRRGDPVPETTLEAMAIMSRPGERTSRSMAAAKRANRIRGRKGYLRQTNPY
jgi:signal recognition particle GTPase